MTVITLTTDFGTGDHEAGVLKGVIWNIAPTVKIADLSHDIPPHDILEAAISLWRLMPYFPAGTIHVVVVDPGVGTSRRGIAARLGSQYFVGPDNGLITLVLERAEQDHLPISLIQLDDRTYWLPEVNPIFHGRDVFAPSAAHLAAGISLTSLGSPITDPVRLDIPHPTRTSQGWQAQVIHIDHFGNLSTNLLADRLGQPKNVLIRIFGAEIHGLVETFGDRPAGELVALIDSSGSLAISVVNGNAAQSINAHMGDKIELVLVDSYADS